MQPIRTLIADDHAVLREGLRQLLSRQQDIEVVGEAVDGIDALEKVRTLKPDILLLDISMPRMGGLEVLRLVRKTAPETGVVMLSLFERDAFAREALGSGASGYVLKGAPSSEILAAVRQAHAGRHFHGQPIPAAQISGRLAGVAPERMPAGYDRLTEREKRVFGLLVRGNSPAQIGERLGIGHKTVERHRTNITRKLGTNGSVEVVPFAARQGTPDSDPEKG